MQSKAIVVLITAPSLEAGKTIARDLVDKRLAACVNILDPIHSIYTWKGEVQSEVEVLLLVKTRADVFETQLIPAVRAVHPYELPEIIALPIQDGLPDYLNWILSESGGEMDQPHDR